MDYKGNIRSIAKKLNYFDNIDIIAITHRIWMWENRKKWGFDKILEWFSKRWKKILLIEHPLFGLKFDNANDTKTVISILDDWKYNQIYQKSYKKSSNMIQWLWEIFFNIYVICLCVKKWKMFFSSNPLNNISAIIVLFRFSFTYFHIVDYSEYRFWSWFKNKILNLIYRTLFWISVKLFDLISVVSKRTQNIIECKYFRKKDIFYMPNSPEFQQIDIPKSKDNVLIYTSNWITPHYMYEFVIDMLNKIHESIPNIKLIAIWKTDLDTKYMSYIQRKIQQYWLQWNVLFVWFVDYNDELPWLLNQAKLWLAFYDHEQDSHVIYWDSIKLREYALYWLPSVMNNNCATVDEFMENKCWVVVEDIDQAVDSVIRLLKDSAYYQEFSLNCIDLSKKTDKRILIDLLMWKIFKSK